MHLHNDAPREAERKIGSLTGFFARRLEFITRKRLWSWKALFLLVFIVGFGTAVFIAWKKDYFGRIFGHEPVTPPLACTMYGVHDAGGTDTQFFKIFTGEPQTSTLLGALYNDYDIEAIDIHPTTKDLYAIAGGGGNKDGNLYRVDKDTGALTLIGNTGTGGSYEIVSASFHPDGTLWAFQEGVGLVTVNLTTAETTLQWRANGGSVLGDSTTTEDEVGDTASIDANPEESVNTDDSIDATSSDNEQVNESNNTDDGQDTLSAGDDDDKDDGREDDDSDDSSEDDGDGDGDRDEDGDNDRDDDNDGDNGDDDREDDGDRDDDHDGDDDDGDNDVGDNWEGLAWNNDGTLLYGSDGSDLYAWNPSTKKASKACGNLPDPTEALDFRPDGKLFGGWHKPDNQSLSIFEVNPQSCTISETDYQTQYNDVESIAFDTCVQPPPPGQCELTITKEGPATVLPGGELQYTIVVKNQGTEICDGNGVELKEFYDPKAVFISANPPPTSSNAVWNLGSIPGGEERRVSVVARAAGDGEPGQDIVNKACVQYKQSTTSSHDDDGDGDDGHGGDDDDHDGEYRDNDDDGDDDDDDHEGDNNDDDRDDEDDEDDDDNEGDVTAQSVCATVTTKIQPPPPGNIDLSLTKQANVLMINPNQNVTFTITVKNDGPAAAAGVAVHDLLPPALSYVSDTGGGAYASSTGTWTIGALPVGATSTLQVVTRATAVGTYTNIAEVVAPLDQTDADSIPNNHRPDEDDQASVSVEVTQLPVPPALEVKKTVTDDDEENVKANKEGPGGLLTYTISIKNIGGSTAQNVRMEDDYDEQYLSITNPGVGTDNGTKVTHGFGDLAAGNEVQALIAGVVRPNAPDGTVFMNTVSARADNTTSSSDWVQTTVEAPPPPEAKIDIIANCKTVNATSTKDISSVEVVFKDGSNQKFENLSGLTWTNTFAKEVAQVTVKSGQTVVTKQAEACPPPGECKLTIAKSASKSSAAVGDIIEYNIKFENTGTAQCTGGGVKVEDIVDAHLELVNGSVSQSGNVSAGYGGPLYSSTTRTLQWNAFELDPNESGWVKWSGKVLPPEVCGNFTVRNTAKISSYEYQNFGTWVTSNTVDTQVTHDCPPPPGPRATLTLTKRITDANETGVASNTVAPGETFTYTLRVENAGTTTAENVSLVDNYQESLLNIISVQGGTDSGSAVTWGLGDLAPLSSTTREIVVQAKSSIEQNLTIFNAATSTADNADAVTAQAQTQVAVPVPPDPPRLQVIKTVTDDDETDTAANDAVPGEPLFYTIIVSNIGGSTSTNTTLVDNYHDTFFKVSNSGGGTDDGIKISYTLGDLAPGGSVTKMIGGSVATGTPDAAQLLNRATADADNADPAEDTTQTKVTVPAPTEIDLSLEKSVDDNAIELNQTVVFTLTLANNGPAPATGVSVEDVLPAGMQYISDNGAGAYATGTGIWTVGSVGIGAVKTLSITARAIAAGTHTNTAQVETATQHDIDSAPGNDEPLEDDQDSVTVTVQSPPPPGCTSNCSPPPTCTSNCGGGGGGGSPSFPKIFIDKIITVAFANPGQIVEYRFTVRNNGSAAAQGVQVTDTLPEGLSFEGSGGKTRVWNMGNLSTGASTSTSYLVVIESSVQAGLYENKAVATIQNGSAPNNRSEDTALLDVRIPLIAGVAKLDIGKSASLTITGPGQEYDYTVTVQNTGSAVATNVTMTDVLPSGITFADGGGREKTFTLGDLAGGEMESVTYKVRVAGTAGAGIYVNHATARADNADPASTQAQVRVFIELPDTGVPAYFVWAFLFGGLLLCGAGWRMMRAGWLEPDRVYIDFLDHI